MSITGLLAYTTARAARTDARIEDLEFLLDNGEDPARAVARVDWSLAAAERALMRRGRNDLAMWIRGAA